MKQKKSRSSYLHTLMLLLYGLLIGCVTMPWQTASDIPELVSEGIYRGPRPNFEELKKADIGTIISLEDNAFVIAAEKATATKMNIKFINCPMSETVAPSPDILRNIVKQIDKNKAGRVYVHCRRGIDRTGYAIAAYRIVNEGWTFDQAYNEVLKHGHSAIYYYSWQASLKALSKGIVIPCRLKSLSSVSVNLGIRQTRQEYLLQQKKQCKTFRKDLSKWTLMVISFMPKINGKVNG